MNVDIVGIAVAVGFNVIGLAAAWWAWRQKDPHDDLYRWHMDVLQELGRRAIEDERKRGEL